MESVRTGLRQIMHDLLRTRPAEEAVMLAWPLVCGKEVAARTRAVSFSEGSLVVEVTDIAWRNQLQSFAPRYISGYEGLLGQVVQSVQFKVQQSAVSKQQPANLQQSAVSNQQSAKPAYSNSGKRSISTDGSTSTSKESFPNKKM
jgi:Dna[CI] antecedent, DciA